MGQVLESVCDITQAFAAIVFSWIENFVTAYHRLMVRALLLNGFLRYFADMARCGWLQSTLQETMSKEAAYRRPRD